MDQAVARSSVSNEPDMTQQALATDVTVIVPNHLHAEMTRAVLNAISHQTVSPALVIIVQALKYQNSKIDWAKEQSRYELRGLVLHVIHAEHPLKPGAARNLGLQFARNNWVAFLDIETIPETDWLERQLQRIRLQGDEVSFGTTRYHAESFKEAIIRDAIYGRRFLITIPGAVMKKDVFGIVGQFIPGVRAAEDTEWMIRANEMGLKIAKNSGGALVSYCGLKNLGIRALVKKWRRNYLSSRTLQHLRVQTTIVWLVVYVVGSLLAFNWNDLIAGWQLDSPFYIDHVTKIVSLSPIALYIIFRGCYLPFKRGVPFSDLFPLRFLLLASVGAILDTVKVSTIFISIKRNE